MLCTEGAEPEFCRIDHGRLMRGAILFPPPSQMEECDVFLWCKHFNRAQKKSLVRLSVEQ